MVSTCTPLVTAREEERRRLRRDLHDGLGPTLTSQALKLDAALDLLAGDPESGAAPDPVAVHALLTELKAQTQATVADIRRLVYELRPPALDELGLGSAIRKHAMRYAGSAGGPHISIEAPPELPPLSAAVEVAAHRIVLEAITNVARHARACSCLVRFSLAETLQVEIIDHGVGLPRELRAGVGSASMRERAGARGYILKGADKNEMLRAIRTVARGEALFGPAIARRLTQFFAGLDSSARPAVPLQVFPELTDREREALNLIAQGLNNAEIAGQLSLSPKTVSNHISNNFSKLQVADRAQAIIRAREVGLGPEKT